MDAVPARDVELSLIAYIGEQPGAPAKLHVKWTGRAGGAKPRLFALLVGVSARE